MKIATWLKTHKALLGAIAAAVTYAAPVIPPPYNALALAVAGVLGGHAAGTHATRAHLASLRRR